MLLVIIYQFYLNWNYDLLEQKLIYIDLIDFRTTRVPDQVIELILIPVNNIKEKLRLKNSSNEI